MGRTVPTKISINLIKNAIAASGKSKFLLEGYPRLVSAGYPGVHDQMFDIEDELGEVQCVLHCTSSLEKQLERAKGSQTNLTDELDSFQRELQPVIDYMEQVSTVKSVDTTDINACAEVLAKTFN